MRVTAALLRRLGACNVSRRLVGPLLPFTLHLDPERNVDLAVRLLAAYARYARAQGVQPETALRWDLYWLASRGPSYRRAGDLYDVQDLSEMATLVPQWLAVVADCWSRS